VIQNYPSAEFNDAYRAGMHLTSLGRLYRQWQVTDGETRRGLRSALLFRLLASGLQLDEAGAVLS
jgi:hypothetical protein